MYCNRASILLAGDTEVQLDVQIEKEDMDVVKRLLHNDAQWSRLQYDLALAESHRQIPQSDNLASVWYLPIKDPKDRSYAKPNKWNTAGRCPTRRQLCETLEKSNLNHIATSLNKTWKIESTLKIKHIDFEMKITQDDIEFCVDLWESPMFRRQDPITMDEFVLELFSYHNNMRIAEVIARYRDHQSYYELLLHWMYECEHPTRRKLYNALKKINQYRVLERLVTKWES